MLKNTARASLTSANQIPFQEMQNIETMPDHGVDHISSRDSPFDFECEIDTLITE
jgi:hypothetical protein